MSGGTRDRMRSVDEHLAAVLQVVQPLSTLEVLSADARERLLSSISIAEGHAFSPASAPHQRFMDWAVRTPEATCTCLTPGSLRTRRIRSMSGP